MNGTVGLEGEGLYRRLYMLLNKSVIKGQRKAQIHIPGAFSTNADAEAP